MFPQAGAALERLLHAHYQPQQGGFPGPIGAHKGDAIAPLDFQFGAQKQDAIAVAVGEVVELGHLAAGAGRRRKTKAGTAKGIDGRFDALHLVEQFFAALGLGAAGGAGPETIDVGLLGGELLLLALKGGLAGFALEGFLLEVLAVVAQVAARDAPLGFNDLVADPIEEGPVVADHHQGHGLLDQIALQPLNCFHIQVVGGLVE